MRKADRMVAFATAAAVATLVSAAHAVPTLDGTLDAEYGAALAVQNLQTSFGDNQSELDAAYGRVEGGKLYLFFAGNVESNYNKFTLFIDSAAGGQNQIRGDNGFGNINRIGNTTQGTTTDGLKFDAAFSPDYVVSFTRDTGSAYVDFGELRTDGGGVGGYAGPIPTINGTPQIGSGTAGGSNGIPLLNFGYNDSNTGGVGGNIALPGDQAAAAAVTTGLEFSVDLADIGAPNGDIRIGAFINGQGHDFLSNQVLGSVPFVEGGQNHLGEPRGIDFNAFAGDQFITIAGVTTPLNAWTSAVGGAWSDATKWSLNTVPNGGARATLGPVNTTSGAIDLDVDVTLSNLTVDSANAYTVATASARTLTFNGASPQSLNVVQGQHAINAAVTFNTGAHTIETAGTATITLGGAVTATGANLFKTGTGTATLPATSMNSLTVNGGTARLTGTATATSVMKGVTVNPGATLDLTNTALVIDYDDTFSPRDAVKASIVAGRITSSTLVGSKFAIGYADTAATPSLLAFNGVPLDPSSLVFQQTLRGDATLSRAVDFADLVILAQNYNGGEGKQWYEGDFDYDGLVGFTDLVSLAQNYSQSTGMPSASVLASLGGSAFAADWALAQSMVPEPTSLAAIVAAAGLLGRRRR